jgi:hypothetical protein
VTSQEETGPGRESGWRGPLAEPVLAALSVLSRNNQRPDPRGIRWSGTSLHGLRTLGRAQLSGADLTLANLFSANLTGTDLTDAKGTVTHLDTQPDDSTDRSPAASP